MHPDVEDANRQQVAQRGRPERPLHRGVRPLRSRPVDAQPLLEPLLELVEHLLEAAPATRLDVLLDALPEGVPHVGVTADVDVGLGLTGHHRLGARDVRDLVEHAPARAVGGQRLVAGARRAPEVDHAPDGVRVRVDELAEVAGRRGVQCHPVTVPTLVGMPTREDTAVDRPAELAQHGLARPLGLAVAAGLVAVVVAAVLTGAVAPLDLGDPGPLVRWGVPVVSTISTLAASATVGLLGLAAFLMPERARTNRRVTATRYAARAATVWAVAALLEVVLAFADLAGTPLTSPDLLDQLISFVWTLETTRMLLISALVAVVVAACATLTTRRAPMAWLAVLTLVRGRDPRAHRARRRVGQPRGCRERARRPPPRRRRLDRWADRPHRHAPWPRRRPRRDRVALLDGRGLVLRSGDRDRHPTGVDPARVARGDHHALRRRRRPQDAGDRGARGARLAAPAVDRDPADRRPG